MSPRRKGNLLFYGKHLMLLGLMAMMLCTSLVLTAGIASAKTTTSALASGKLFCGGSCDGKNPVYEDCYADAQSYYTNTAWAVLPTNYLPGIEETITIRYSYSCRAAWATVKFSRPLPSGWHGNAIITRTSDNRQFDCAHGGNDIVYPGQTSCYSGMVDDGSYTTAWAAGMSDAGNGWWEVVRSTGAF